MSNKIMYITDIHYGAYPVCRKDNYNESILNKLKCCLDVAYDEGIKLVFLGGDLFDRPNQTFGDMTKLIYALKPYSKHMRFLTNKGNPTHDGNDKNSPLTFLNSVLDKFTIVGNLKVSNLNHFNMITKVTPTQSIMDDKKRFKAFNDDLSYDADVMFVHNTSKLSEIEIHKNPKCKNDKLFIFTHHIISKEKVPYEHVLMEDFANELKEKNNKQYKNIYVFVADYHPYQGIIFDYVGETGVVFVAPGSLARRKYTKDNIEKVPHYVIVEWDIDNHDNFGIKIGDVECEKDVWHLPEKNQKVMNTELDMQTFQDELSDFEEELDFKASWKKFAATINVSDEVAKELNERLFGENKND